MAEQWQGWVQESVPRRWMFALTLPLLAALAAISIIGTMEGGGLSSPWLWSGLLLVPILLWLVSRVGLNR